MEKDPILYLNSLGLHTVKPGLQRIKSILSALGNPQEKVPGVIVGGTNGKGSVAAAVSSVLSEAGYKTGLYTSPHLVKINERIKIDGSEIKDEELNNSIDSVRRAAKENNIQPSYFEVITAAAFLHFADSSCEINVLEVGMGGRWDATNVITPLSVVITNISKDHTEYLGETVELIAAEKACLIKPGVPVVTGATGGALEVIRDTANENSSELYILDKDFSISEKKDNLSYLGSIWNVDNIHTSLLGLYQHENTALAVKALETLLERGHVSLNEKQMKEGLSKIDWEGRFQVIREKPLLVLDSAHNPGAARALALSLKHSYPGVKFTFLIGMLGDKDHGDFFNEISETAEEIIITRVPSERSADPAKLLESTKEYTNNAIIIEDYKEAFGVLKASGKPACVTGSLYLIGALKDDPSNL